MSDAGDTFAEVFLSAMEVSKKLGQLCPSFPRKTEILIEMVEKAISSTCSKPYKIHFHPRNFQSKAFIGSVEAFEDHAHIYYDRDRSLCWRRFVVTKEMCHLLFAPHGAPHLCSTPAEIEQLLVSILAGLEKADPNDHPVSTEVCTVLMALEILLPHGQRANIPDKASAFEVATEYRIPEQMAKLYLSPGYIGMMTKVYRIGKYDISVDIP